MIEYEKEELFKKLRNIANQWHRGTRIGNDGNQGNTLEDLLEIPENNLSLPDYGSIELKTQKKETGSLITLFHKEPLPMASIPKLLTSMGWKHKEAGKKHPENEMSFRTTTPSSRYTNRGFTIDLTNDRITLNFDITKVDINANDKSGAYNNLGDWLECINHRTEPHYSKVLPVYWERDAFEKKCREKLEHTVFVTCKTKKIDGVKYFYYDHGLFLSGFNSEKLYKLFASDGVLIDFDARTGHNHGTKLRIKSDLLVEIFDDGEKIF